MDGVEDILISVIGGESRVAVLHDGVVSELYLEKEDLSSSALFGNVYLGKVTRILPGMQSAFIDIEPALPAFISLSDNIGRPKSAQHGHKLHATCFAHEQQSMLVQVVKEGTGFKSPRVSRKITLSSRYLVFSPTEDNSVSVSGKIIDLSLQEQLRERLLRFKNEQPNVCGAWIVRTAAASANDNGIRNDLSYLTKTWAAICIQARTASCPSLIYRELPLPLRALRDLVGANTRHIYIDSANYALTLKNFAEQFFPELLSKIVEHNDVEPLFDRHAVEQAIDSALLPRVELASGGYILIQHTEAMTVVDVNTGSFLGESSLHETILKTNLEAVSAITQQIRLRNIAGIILVDFIDMRFTQHQQIVLNKLRQLLKKDPSTTTVGNFTSLGLIELTRRRRFASLTELLCKSCNICSGRGLLESEYAISQKIIRRLLYYKSLALKTRGFRVLLSGSLMDYFLSDDSRVLRKAEFLIGCRIVLQHEPYYDYAVFDIFELT